MGVSITITSGDGFELDAYLAMPEGEPKAAILVIQEIFGVNAHIREVADGYAADGYAALAPALFDRVEKGVELDYEGDDLARGAGIAFNELDMANTLADLAACANHLTIYGKVGSVGYCYGGLMSFLSSCNSDVLACSVGYYGGGIANNLDQKPKIPLMLHFGELDAHIPMEDVEKIKAVNTDVPVHTYNADHGFNCDHRASFNAQAAKIARERTIEFFEQHLA